MNSSSNASTLGDHFTRRQEPGRAGLPTLSVTMHDGLVHREELERRTESALAPEQHLLVRKGDIAYNMMRMWQGACGLAETDAIVSPAYVVLTSKGSIDSRFAVHWFKSPRMLHLLWAYSHGLTKDRLRLYFDDFCLIPAMPPPLDEQHRIVAVLDAWDRAIDLVQRLLVAVRRQRHALLQTFFGGSETLPLWKRRSLADAVGGAGRIIGGPFGSDLTSSDYVETGVPVIRGTNMEFSGRWIGGDFVYVTPEKARALQKNMASRGDIVVTQRGTLGQVSIIPETSPFEAFIVSQSQMAISCRSSNILRDYIYCYLVSEQFQRIIETETVQTGLPHINLSILRSAEIPVPAIDEQQRIVAAIDIWERSVETYASLMRRLNLQKKIIGQKLLTGEWRLAEHIDHSLPVPALLAVGAGIG